MRQNLEDSTLRNSRMIGPGNKFETLFKQSSAAFGTVVTAGAGTYTAAQILDGVIIRDCTGASRTDTLPTAALLVAAMVSRGMSPQVGDLVQCLVINGSDPTTEIVTLAPGAGGTWDAVQTAVSRTILGSSQKELNIRLTNVTAAAETYAVCA